MRHSFNLSFIQKIFTEMGRARDKGPEELNRDTDKRRSGRELGKQVWRGIDLTHLSPQTDALTGEGHLRSSRRDSPRTRRGLLSQKTEAIKYA